MKIIIYILFTLLISNLLLAQQVTKVDCCLDVGNKATIIVNNNITNSISTNSISTNATVNNNNNKCNFKLNTSSNTSAGIYNSSDNLVRTLWSGIHYDAGCYNLQWDGNLDDGTPAPFGNYTVKVLTNNVQYTWEGVIGNTSTHLTGDSVYRGDLIYDLCFVGNKGFFANGGSERGATQRYFTVGKSNAPNTVYRQTTQSSYKVCSDGNILYWAGNDSYTGAVWVYGAYPADNADPYAAQVPFSSGVPYSTHLDGFNYGHAILLATRPGESFDDYNQKVDACAVQKNGSGLWFGAINHQGKLYVVNKTTGALLQTVAMPAVNGIACDAANGVYISHAGVLEKFIANADGTLATTGTTVPGIGSAGALAVSPGFALLSVADNATNQVKNYSLPNLTLQSTLGTGESYATNPYVSNNKFYGISFLAYQSDGSIWVGDPGNYRYEHFNQDLSYKEQIAYVPGSRSSKADRNNPKRIFADELEFERDYSKPLDNGTNGSWKLKANWKAGTAGYLDVFGKFTSVVTLSNGHTYATGRTGSNTLFDLTPTGAILLDGNFFGEHGIESDGTVFTVPQQSSGYVTINKNLLTGFDQNNKPIWGNPTLFATSPLSTNYTPWNLGEGTQGQTATADKYVFFNNNAPNDNNFIDYHLGAVKAGGNTALWLASRGTFLNYSGNYPSNGDFDTGNGSHSSTHAYVYCNDIFWNVNCEFWGAGKSSQPQNNIWNHFNNDGLFIGQFGLTGQTAESLGQAAPGMAGNALYNAMVKVGNDYYIYHCDESYHAGVHSWHVTGLNTIAEQSIPITINAAVTAQPDPADLMAGLPFKSASFTSGNGWTATGATASTNTMQYSRSSTDISIGGANIQTLTRSLNNTNAASGSWSLTGGVNFYQSQGTLGGNQFNYLEVLDQSGKAIARFQNYVHGSDYHQYLIINDITFADGPNGSFPELANFNDFSLNYSAGVLTFQYAGHSAVTITRTSDSGATMAAPASIRINQSSPGNQYHQMDLYKLRFNSTN